VVRDLQEPRAETTRRPTLQVLLSLDLDVAGQQRDATPPRDPEHERGVVGFAPRPAERTSGWRGQDLDLELRDPSDLAGRGLGHVGPGATGRVSGRGHQRPLERDGTPPELRDGRPSEHRGHATEVIGVGVADDQQVETSVAVASQPRGCGIAVARIHEEGGARSLDQDRVALSHVDGGHAQRVRGAADDR